jgi:acetyltransferase-like isoleucine patch superfamily enzyme
MESNQKINYVGQGGSAPTLMGDLTKFKIGSTSHLKSDTVIDCSGGISIGECFHTGKGLVIITSNHNYDSEKKIPYDEADILSPVTIEDYVWFGVNVTVLPGVTIGEGAVVAANSVISKSVLPYSVMGGNPAKILKMRDVKKFNKLKLEKKFLGFNN